MFSKLHKNNLKHVKAILKNGSPEAFIHGDGNVYSDKENSDNAVTFSNNALSAQTFRVRYVHPDQVPNTLDELIEALEKNRREEQKKAQAPTAKKVSNVVVIEEDENEAIAETKVKTGRKPKADKVDGEAEN